MNNKTISIKIAYASIISVFIGFGLWWTYNYFTQDVDAYANELFADTYWVLPLLGGIGGLWAASKWGSLKSVFGRSIFFLAAGLLAQVFGQVVYSVYALLLNVEAPYPSLGDIGFFGSIILYIIALSNLSKATGARFSAVSFGKKIIAIGLPLALLAGSFIVFLRGYEVDWSSPLVVLLDFGYPLGQAIYLSLALLIFFLSRGMLGGIIKNKIILLLVALLVQYTADFLFLFRINRETWYPGDISDLIYLVAYLLMGVALLQLGSTVLSLNQKQQEAPSES